MDSPLVSLFALLILAAVLVTLYLLQSRTLQRNFDTFREDTGKAIEVSVAMSRSELAANRERAAAGARELTEATERTFSAMVTSQQQSTLELVRAMDLMTTRQQSGFAASTRQNTELLTSLAAHIATKDTAGYERVMAASGTPLRSDPDAPPYAVPAEPEDIELLRQQMDADEAAEALLRQAGIRGRMTGGATVFGPYPGDAGAAES